MTDMLPVLPDNPTRLQRHCLYAERVLRELDVLASDLTREGDPEAADEVLIARARIFRVLASRIEPQRQWRDEQTAAMEQEGAG